MARFAQITGLPSGDQYGKRQSRGFSFTFAVQIKWIEHVVGLDVPRVKQSVAVSVNLEGTLCSCPFPLFGLHDKSFLLSHRQNAKSKRIP